MIDPDLPAELRLRQARLASSRVALERSLDALEAAAREELDLSRRVAVLSPWLALAGFGFGVWLGSRA